MIVEGCGGTEEDRARFSTAWRMLTGNTSAGTRDETPGAEPGPGPGDGVPAAEFGVLPGIGILGGWPARCPQLAEGHVQRVQVGGGHQLVHPGG